MTRHLVAAALVLLAQDAGASTLRRGNAADPETLDPQRARSVSAGNVLRDVFEGLVTENPDGTLVPGAAESWSVSADGRRWTFILRQNLRWSTGEPLTAPDFVTGLRRALDPGAPSPSAQLLLVLTRAREVLSGAAPAEALGVEAPDAQTLVLRLVDPAPYLPGILAQPVAFPRYSGPAPGLVGNGAYRLEQWRPQAELRLVRNPQYRDASGVAIDEVIYFPAEDPAAELKRYRAGELDWTDTVPMAQLRWVRDHLGAELMTAPYFGTYYYGFNLTRPPFRDAPGLRRALALTLDREALVAALLGAGEQAALGFVPPGLPGYTAQAPEWTRWSKEKRLSEARRLYAEAGYSADKPLRFELRYNSGDNHRRLAVAAAWMWREALGTRVDLVNEEYKVYLQNRRARRVTQLFRADWIGDFADAASFAERMLSGTGLDDTGWQNPRYDARVREAAATADPGRRRALLEEAERILLDDLPLLPVYVYASKHLVKPWVIGARPNMMDHHYSRFLRLAPR